MPKSLRFADWVSARIRQFYRWRHGTECARRLLILDQMMAFDGIAVIAATIRGHELGEWHIHDSSATVTCLRCGRGLVVHYSLLQPDMDGALLRHECKRDRPQTIQLEIRTSSRSASGQDTAFVLCLTPSGESEQND